ncbi:MAG: hypothetical protein ACD_74C00183G0001, partial [uncultured bacterium]
QRVLDAMENPEADLNLDNIDVTLPSPVTEASTPKRRKIAQGMLFG